MLLSKSGLHDDPPLAYKPLMHWHNSITVDPCLYFLHYNQQMILHYHWASTSHRQQCRFNNYILQSHEWTTHWNSPNIDPIERTWTWRSNRPGLSIAGSRTSGLFVAAMTITLTDGDVATPSSSVNNWFNVCSLSSRRCLYIREWGINAISSIIKLTRIQILDYRLTYTSWNFREREM